MKIFGQKSFNGPDEGTFNSGYKNSDRRKIRNNLAGISKSERRSEK